MVGKGLQERGLQAEEAFCLGIENQEKKVGGRGEGLLPKKNHDLGEDISRGERNREHPNKDRLETGGEIQDPLGSWGHRKKKIAVGSCFIVMGKGPSLS